MTAPLKTKSLVAVYMVRSEVGAERNLYNNLLDTVVIKVSDTSYGSAELTAKLIG